ncbi:hypothetical protein [Pedococcus aerophilus]|uniref:hypothetical protein n=1 Tax=Pedococcus aerophilus TaxID=436356 RepID=UPI0031D3FBBC
MTAAPGSLGIRGTSSIVQRNSNFGTDAADIDFMRYALTAGSAYSLELIAGSMGMNVALYDSANTRMTSTSCSAGALCGLSVTPSISGTYFLRITPSSSVASGSYTLCMQANAFRCLTSTPTPTVTGTAKVAQTLTATPGAWGPAPVALAYQWYRRSAAGVNTAISGASAATYKVQAADVGFGIQVRVTGSRSGYTTVSKYSATTSTVIKASLTATPAPTITGTAKVNGTLTAVPGTWGPAPVTLAYQWYRRSAAGVNAAISGASAATYKVQAADVGFGIQVRVTGSKSGYTTVSKYSAGTGAITSG